MAPAIDSVPVRIARLRASEAVQNVALVDALGFRCQGNVEARGEAQSVVSKALASIEMAEADGIISPERAMSLRSQVQNTFNQEADRLKDPLREIDRGNARLRQQVDGAEVSLSEAGMLALARGPLIDRLVAEHMERQVRPGALPQETDAQRERFLEDLGALSVKPEVNDLDDDLEALTQARLDALSMAAGLEHLAPAGGLEVKDPDWAAFAAARTALELAKAPGRQISGEVERLEGEALERGEAVRTGNGVLLTDYHARAELKGKQLAAELLVGIGPLGASGSRLLRDRAAVSGNLGEQIRTGDRVDQATVETVVLDQLKYESKEMELFLAVHGQDEALTNLLFAAERVQRRNPAMGDPEATRGVRSRLMAARAQGVDARVLARARAEAEDKFRREGLEFLQANLPLLEVPDNLPDLKMLEAQAGVASQSMGFGRAWGDIRQVEPRDFAERVRKMAAYWSICQDSIGGRAVFGSFAFMKATGEHLAAALWAAAQTLTKVTAHQLTDATKSIATGRDPQAALQAAMDLATVGGQGIGQSWAFLALTKSVRNQRVQIGMQRRSEKREMLQNRRQEIDRIVKNVRDGAELKASYLDQVKLLREQIKGYLNAGPQEREGKMDQALMTMEGLDHKMQMMALDHQDIRKEILGSREISPRALRNSAATALAQAGLWDASAAFDERRTGEIREQGLVDQVHIHLAVDASAHLREVVQHEDRTPDPLNQKIRDLVKDGFGNHGNLASGMMVADSSQGPVGILFNPGNPPGVALVEFKAGPGGEFEGFKGVETFDLARIPIPTRSGVAAGANEKETRKSFLREALQQEFPRWADDRGLGSAKADAVMDYLSLALEHEGWPLQNTLPGSYGVIQNLRGAGIISGSTALDDGSVMPMSSDIAAYWENFSGRGADTAKLQAAIEAISLERWSQAAARQAIVCSVIARLKKQEEKGE